MCPGWLMYEGGLPFFEEKEGRMEGGAVEEERLGGEEGKRGNCDWAAN